MESPAEPTQRSTAFTLRHPLAVLVVWFPLNPFVLHHLSRVLLAPYPEYRMDLGAYLGLLSTTILGPFTAALEGRNRSFCMEMAYQLLPVCLGAIVLAVLIQIFWRPKHWPSRAIRMGLWMLGWFVWFCGAFLSILSNSG